ncbi:MAG TPA: hypothetical protein VFR37_13900 [Longimicrobium sp.]|nr:hypothetical protein [Longimicrobium sp.]
MLAVLLPPLDEMLHRDARTVWLHEPVTVLPSPRGVPARLRGWMVPVLRPDGV